jgi:hypothetical protein
MVDIAKAKKSLEDYFANVTKEQFDTDLQKFCPELFEEENEGGSDSIDSTLLRKAHEHRSELRLPFSSQSWYHPFLCLRHRLCNLSQYFLSLSSYP